MHNYKLTIQYDGSGYAGWQRQNNAVTVQEKTEEALTICCREKIVITGSGRTDTGVHALGQTANFRIKKELDLFRLVNSVNALTPDDIVITNAEEVHENFHSRYDATDRSYIYLFTKKPSPFYKNYAWHFPPVFRIDVKKLNEISKALTGWHDFSSLSRKNDEIDNKFCNINNITWSDRNGMLLFYINGNRFLHGMVRAVIGTLLEAVDKPDPESYLLNILEEKDRSAGGQSVPAHGLFLFKVKY